MNDAANKPATSRKPRIIGLDEIPPEGLVGILLGEAKLVTTHLKGGNLSDGVIVCARYGCVYCKRGERRYHMLRFNFYVPGIREARILQLTEAEQDRWRKSADTLKPSTNYLRVRNDDGLVFEDAGPIDKATSKQLKYVMLQNLEK